MVPVSKTIYLLNIDNFAPEITQLTYPLIYAYAKKIDAEIEMITERKYPDWPVTYEKLQIRELAKQNGNDWHIYIDSDAIVHPDCIDFTVMMSKAFVLHTGKDRASMRWRYDEYFIRDGRHIGSGNWFTIASNWCLDLWQPLDITKEEALEQIYPINHELNTVITKEHLIDDFTLSRNIARYGLKMVMASEIYNSLGIPITNNFFWHHYTIPIEEKVKKMKEFIVANKLEGQIFSFYKNNANGNKNNTSNILGTVSPEVKEQALPCEQAHNGDSQLGQQDAKLHVVPAEAPTPQVS